MVEGEVKRSVTIFASSAEVSGTIGRELTMAGGSLTLTNTDERSEVGYASNVQLIYLKIFLPALSLKVARF